MTKNWQPLGEKYATFEMLPDGSVTIVGTVAADNKSLGIGYNRFDLVVSRAISRIVSKLFSEHVLDIINIPI